MSGREVPAGSRRRLTDRTPLGEKLQWTIDDVVSATSLSERTIFNLVDRGVFPKPYQPPSVRRKFWVPDAVRAWVDQQARGEGAA